MKAKIHAWGRDWEWFGKDLGRVLGRFWMLLGSFGPLFGFIFSCLHSEWSLKGLLEPSGLDFGATLEDLGGILASFLGVLDWSLRSKSVLAFACFCLLGLAFA